MYLFIWIGGRKYRTAASGNEKSIKHETLATSSSTIQIRGKAELRDLIDFDSLKEGIIYFEGQLFIRFNTPVIKERFNKNNSKKYIESLGQVNLNVFIFINFLFI